MAEVPIIDFQNALNGSEEQRVQVAQDIDKAFQNAGFVYLKNHGVPQSMIDECFTWSEKFFALPLETKLLAPHPPGGSHHRGYSAPGVEKVSQHTYDSNEITKLRETPDFKESFESGNINDEAQPNIWLPDHELPGFRDFMERYFVVCADLVHRILDSLSLALNVAKPGLSPTHKKSLFQLRILHYPAIETAELLNEKRSRINAHSDFGTLTLLFQDLVGGLEIEDPHSQGRFGAVEPIHDAVLVNVGDLLARWSNDRWRSTVHRVGIPTRKVGNGELVPNRYSIPFFATADMETVIDALPGCWDDDKNPKKYEPVTAWGYVQMRMAALYS